MGAKFSGGGAVVFHDRTDAPGEITRELVNSTDGQGLHFDGAAGNIDIASPPDLGTKFSFELILQADVAASAGEFIFDFYNNSPASRFGFYRNSDDTLLIYDTNNRVFTGSDFLSDVKVHHLVVTVDGTAAIIYDNGNQVGTATLGASATIDDADTLKIGSRYEYSGTQYLFNGTIYRARFWNKTLSSTEVTDAYENATVPFADQWGKQVYASAFASGISSFNPIGLTQAYNEDGVSDGSTSKDDCLKVYADGSSSHFTYVDISGLSAPDTRIKLFYYIPTANTNVDGLRISDGGTGGAGTLVTSTTTGAWTEFETTFTRGSTTRITIYAMDGGSTSFTGAASASDDIIYFNAVTVDSAGCAVDLDLSFAQPEISTQIQDRSTNGVDGTASSSGVTQVTKIEAVNTNKLNVGGTTPLVGIGLDAGVTPSATLHVNKAAVGEYLRAGSGNNRQLRFTSYDTTSDNAGHIIDASSANGEMKLSTGGTERLAISSAGTVSYAPLGNAKSILIDTPTAASVPIVEINDANSLTTGNILYLRSDASNTSTRSLVKIHNDHASATGTTCLEVRNDSTGAAITATGGIAFQSATTGSGTGTGYTLDSYEEGTWTAVVQGGTSAGTYSSSFAESHYTKIGRVVTVNWNLAWSSHTGTGDLQITGLPFTIKSSTAAIGPFQCNSGLSWTAGYLPAAYATGTTIRYRNTDDGAGTYQLLQIAATGNYLRGTLTYFV